MTSTNYSLTRYDSSPNCVFDWAEPRYQDVIDEDGKPTGEQVQEHLYVKTLFIGGNDTIDNYIEVEEVI